MKSIKELHALAHVLLGGMLAVGLDACGDGSNSDTTATPTTPSPATPTTPTYTIGITVSGLTGSGLVLQDNAGDNLTINARGSFTFATALASGASYAVTVKTQPALPAQTCSVASGSGTATANVTSVAVSCVSPVPRFAYVANQTTNNISAYSIDASTGALTQVAGSPFATSNTVDPSGKFAYVANQGSGNVSRSLHAHWGSGTPLE